MTVSQSGAHCLAFEVVTELDSAGDSRDPASASGVSPGEESDAAAVRDPASASEAAAGSDAVVVSDEAGTPDPSEVEGDIGGPRSSLAAGPGSEEERIRGAQADRRARLKRKYRRRRIVLAVIALAVIGGLALVLPPLAQSPAQLAGRAVTSVLTTAGDEETTSTTASTTTAAPTTTTTAAPTTTTLPPVPGITVGALTGGPGPIPVVHRVPTFDPVVFLTIDDGVVKDPAVLEVIRARNVPVTQFLTQQYVGSDPTYFQQLEQLGGVVGIHTRTHPDLTRLSDEAKADQICGVGADYTQTFGAAPELMRPPYGEYDAPTVQVAASCGVKAVMHWSATFEDGQLALQSGTALRPGEVILLHFKDSLASDLQILLDMIAAAGLRPAPLIDYIRSAPPAPPPTTAPPATAPPPTEAVTSPPPA